MDQKPMMSESASELKDGLSNLSSRIKVLEQKDAEMEAEAQKQDMQLKEQLSQLQADVDLLRKQTADAASAVDAITKRIQNLVVGLRRAGKQDNFAKLSRNLEEFQPENWVTNEEFNRMIARRL